MYKVSSDGSTAVDTQVSFYPIDSCPLRLKVQLLSHGGTSTYSCIKQDKDREMFLGWRPVPKISKDETR